MLIGGIGIAEILILGLHSCAKWCSGRTSGGERSIQNDFGRANSVSIHIFDSLENSVPCALIDRMCSQARFQLVQILWWA